MASLFPVTPFDSCGDFASAYFEQLTAAAKGCDMSALDRIAEMVRETIASDNFIYICGNGGGLAYSTTDTETTGFSSLGW